MAHTEDQKLPHSWGRERPYPQLPWDPLAVSLHFLDGGSDVSDPLYFSWRELCIVLDYKRKNDIEYARERLIRLAQMLREIVDAKYEDVFDNATHFSEQKQVSLRYLATFMALASETKYQHRRYERFAQASGYALVVATQQYMGGLQ